MGNVVQRPIQHRYTKTRFKVSSEVLPLKYWTLVSFYRHVYSAVRRRPPDLLHAERTFCRCNHSGGWTIYIHWRTNNYVMVQCTLYESVICNTESDPMYNERITFHGLGIRSIVMIGPVHVLQYFRATALFLNCVGVRSCSVIMIFVFSFYCDGKLIDLYF